MRRSVLLTIVSTLAFAAPASAERPVIAGEITESDDRVVVHAAPDQKSRASLVRGKLRATLDALAAKTGLPVPIDDGDGRVDAYLDAGRDVRVGIDPPRAAGDGRPAYLLVGVGGTTPSSGTLGGALAEAAVVGIDADEAAKGDWWTAATRMWAGRQIAGTTGTTAACRNSREPAEQAACFLSQHVAPAAPGVVAATWERLRAVGAGNGESHAAQALDAELAARGLNAWILGGIAAAAPFSDGSWTWAACALASSFDHTFRTPIAPWTSALAVARLGSCGPLYSGVKLELVARAPLAADARAVIWRGSGAPEDVPMTVGRDGEATAEVPLNPPPEAAAVALVNASAASVAGSVGWRWSTNPSAVKVAVSLSSARCTSLPRRRQRCTLSGTASPVSVREVRVGLLRRLGRGRCVAPLSRSGLRPRSCPRRAPWKAAKLDPARAWRLSVVLPRGRARWRVELRAVDGTGASGTLATTRRIGR